MKQSISFCAALGLLCALGAGGCTKNRPATTPSRVEETRGEITQSEVLSAAVVDVDAANRVISMKDQNGRPFLINVGDNVAIERIRPHDWVNVRYEESVAFSLQEPGTAAADPVVEESTKRVPDGVQFGRTVSTTVEIVSVTADGSHATFRVPEGMVRTVYINDPPNQKKISRLKPGDAVAVTYTELLSVARDRSMR